MKLSSGGSQPLLVSKNCQIISPKNCLNKIRFMSEILYKYSLKEVLKKLFNKMVFQYLRNSSKLGTQVENLTFFNSR